jgi:hypothetical protein
MILIPRCHVEEMNSNLVQIPTRLSVGQKILNLADVGYCLGYLLSGLM